MKPRKVVGIGMLSGAVVTLLAAACSNDKKSLIPTDVVERAEKSNTPGKNGNTSGSNQPNSSGQANINIAADKIDGLSFEKELQGTIYDKDYNDRCAAFESFFRSFQQKHVQESALKDFKCSESFDFKTENHVIVYKLATTFSKGTDVLPLEFQVSGAESQENQIVELLTKNVSGESYQKFGKNLSVLSPTLQTYLRIAQKRQGAYGINYTDFLNTARENVRDFGIASLAANLDFSASSEAQMRIGKVNNLELLANAKPELVGCQNSACVQTKSFNYRFNGTKLYFIDASNAASVYLISDISKNFVTQQ